MQFQQPDESLADAGASPPRYGYEFELPQRGDDLIDLLRGAGSRTPVV